MADRAGSNKVIGVDPAQVLPPGPSGPGYIWGRALRFVLVGELMKRPEVTVAELVVWLTGQGYQVNGRPSKVISDSLRWEIARGRVTRLGRGRYRYNRAPATTARRIRIFAERCRAWITARRQGQQPPPTPPDPRATLFGQLQDCPTHPPWRRIGWLWTT